jgi:hypothetical protein
MFYLLSISFDLYVYREKRYSVMANNLTKHGNMNVHENYCVYFELNPSRKDNMAVGSTAMEAVKDVIVIVWKLDLQIPI